MFTLNVLDQFLVLPMMARNYFFGFWWINGLSAYMIALFSGFPLWAQPVSFKAGGLRRLARISRLVMFWFSMYVMRILQPKYVIAYYWIFLFFSMMIFNFLGLIPYSITLTSFIVSTFFWSLAGFVACFLIIFRGWLWQFVELFSTPGTGLAIRSGLMFIELVSYFARIVSLAIRLFANMMAGHSLLKVLNGFCSLFLVGLSVFTLMGFLLLNIIWIILIMEFCISFLQAYVFMMLSTVYLNEAINQH